MITEIKRTPITWNGEDGWEILVEDDYPYEEDLCKLCMYRDWNEWDDCSASCVIVQGDTLFSRTYFIFKKS